MGAGVSNGTNQILKIGILSLSNFYDAERQNISEVLMHFGTTILIDDSFAAFSCSFFLAKSRPRTLLNRPDGGPTSAIAEAQ